VKRRFLQNIVELRKCTDASARENTRVRHKTFWRPRLPYGYSYKAYCARPG